MTGILDRFVSAFEAHDLIFHGIPHPVPNVFRPKNTGPDICVFVYIPFCTIKLREHYARPVLRSGAWGLDMGVRNEWYASFLRSLFRVETNVSTPRGPIVHVWVSQSKTYLYPHKEDRG